MQKSYKYIKIMHIWKLRNFVQIWNDDDFFFFFFFGFEFFVLRSTIIKREIYVFYWFYRYIIYDLRIL